MRIKTIGSIKGKGRPYSITERRVPELFPVLGSQPAGDVSHKPGGRLPLLSARPAVTPATLGSIKKEIPYILQQVYRPSDSRDETYAVRGRGLAAIATQCPCVTSAAAIA